jgi:hypothetical protein
MALIWSIYYLHGNINDHERQRERERERDGKLLCENLHNGKLIIQ